MLIVHLTSTDPAGAAFNMVKAINTHTSHRARLIATHKLGYEFPQDIAPFAVPDSQEPWDRRKDRYYLQLDSGEEIEELLLNADVLHLHKVVEEEFKITLRGPKSGVEKVYSAADFVKVGGKPKKIVYHIHGHPYERENVEENANRYADRGHPVLASTPDLEQMYRKYFKGVSYFPNIVPINDCAYLPRYSDPLFAGSDGVRKVCVVHTPTDKVLKSCDMIDAAVKHSARVHGVFLYEFTSVTHAVALMAKRVGNIIFDHMEGYYGISSLEGLAMGKPVIAGLSDYTVDAIAKFFGLRGDAEIPWQRPQTQDALNNALIDLVGNPDLRKMIGKTSREFMEKHWSDKNLAEKLVKVYEQA